MQEGYILHGTDWLKFILQLTFVQSISKGKGTDKDGALSASLPTSNIIPMQATSTQHTEPEAMLVDTTASSSGELGESAVKTASVDVRKILQVSFISFFTMYKLSNKLVY